MTAETRRKEIIDRLTKAVSPVSASSLAKEFGVSRQVIVGDIAIIRASGYKIEALARGYMLEKSKKVTQIFKVRHSDDEVEAELNLIVDHGGCVEDVFIFHKCYGAVRAPMDIKSRSNVKQFLADIASGKSSLLKNVTLGYHYHTVTAESSEVLNEIKEALRKNGFLAPLQEFEPAGVDQ